MKTEAPRARSKVRIAATIIVVGGVVVGLLLLLALLLPCDSQTQARKALDGGFGLFVAFMIGMLSFISPCILPLLPGYLSYTSGLSGEDIESGRARRRVLVATSLFVLGFSTIFSLLGASASAIGGALTDHLALINKIAGAVVIVMGLAFLLPSALRFMERERRPLMSKVRPGVAGAYPLGIAFAVGWTPCVGPGFGAMLSLGATQGSAGRGALLLFAFSLGFGIWFILGGLAMRRAVIASAYLRTHARTLQLVGGAFMVTIGVLLVLDRWNSVIGPLRTLVSNTRALC